MTLEIKKYPDSMLKKRAQKIKEIDLAIQKLGQEMIETMVGAAGVGLAANQVGVLQRIIVVQTENGPQVFINPMITRMSSKKEIDTEGCLSIPDLYLNIKRSIEIEVMALDIKWQKINIKAKGFVARIFQHEIDHLNGILIIDRIGFWQRLKLKRKLKQHGPY